MTRIKQGIFVSFVILFLLGNHLLWAAETLIINVTGITGPALTNIQERLNTLQLEMGNKPDINKIKAFHQSAPENIRLALQPFGFFKPTIHSDLIVKKSQWKASYQIYAGPALPMTKIELNITGEGKNNAEIQSFLRSFPLKLKQTLLIDDYNNAVDKLSETASNQGYLKASYEKKEVRINLKTYTAEIILHLNTGPCYYLGSIKFNSNPFSPDFLQRFVHVENQKVFSSQKLVKLQQDLSSSQYFQQVSVNPEFNNIKDFHVPININVVPRKSEQYNIGLGYGTFTGPRLTTGLDFRRVTPTGQHFNTQLKLSPVLRGLAAKYFIPGNNPLSDLYTIGANFQQFVPRNGRSFSENLSASYVKSIDEWQHTISLTYLRERFSINSNPWTSSHLLYPSFNLSRIKADDLINPHHGSTINFNLQGANEAALSQISFVQTELKGKFIFSPTEPSRLILRGDMGYTVVKDLQKLPMTLQFFTGGPNSVRGYRYDSMGPGRYLKIGSVEVQHRIYKSWSGAVFYDAGIASDHFNTPYQHSRGAGIVYNSVIGPIKLYLSRADSTPGRPFRVDFNIGPDF
jgi:translocation and assembly module TamA